MLLGIRSRISKYRSNFTNRCNFVYIVEYPVVTQWPPPCAKSDATAAINRLCLLNLE
jgi:hypothetical protein